MSRYIVSLDHRTAREKVTGGGKGQKLAQLRRFGFNVPPGSVITPAAFRDFLADLDITILSQRSDWEKADLAYIRELLLACHIPDRITRAIHKTYHGTGGRIAVRSSMVGEDARLASFAGQLDTVLNVEGEQALLQAVKKCWASIFNWRLLSYLKERELESPSTVKDAFSIAVVVQPMVDARAAGVAFSANPMTGQPHVIIEAVEGLGDALVQGIAAPQRYVVDARGVLAEATYPDAASPVLTNEQVLHLAEVVRDIAGKMGCPQDIEWAWDEHALHILQSRPITSLTDRKIYSNRMVSDMCPGLIKPLVWSTKIVAMTKNVFGHIFTELIGPSEIDFSTLVKRIHSRVYADMTLLGNLFERVGMPSNFFQMMSRDERVARRHPKITPKMVRAMVRMLRFGWRNARVADEIETFIERHDRALAAYRYVDWATYSPQDILAQVGQLMNLHSESQWYVFIGPMNMMVRNKMLERLTRSRAPDVAPNDLIRGLLGLKALEPNQEIERMAAQASRLGRTTRSLLATGDNSTIRAALSASSEGQSLLDRMNAFMARYGFLSPNGTDFTETPWVENPTLIWHAVGRQANTPQQHTSVNVEQVRESARAQVRARLNWVERWAFDRLLSATSTFIDLRERTSLLMSEDSYHMHRLFLALADHFVAAGKLEMRNNIFYLMYDEVQQLARGELERSTVRQLIATRQAEMVADAQIEPPDVICGDTIPLQPVAADGANKQPYLTGISGSSGTVQGYARIILTPDQAPALLAQNDILVVPFTDVGWTPLFSGISGIVAETGGQLSHTSIVAREYGLPAVVSVRQATQLIKEGQPVTIDGNNGRVYLRHLAE